MFTIKPCEETETGWVIWDGLSYFAVAENEDHAFMIAASLNMMDARERKGTPWEVMVAVQANVIQAAEAIFDAILESNPFGLINRQCKYCQITWGVGSALLQKAGIDDEVRKADPKETTHKPTCLFSAAVEWKIASADRVEEAIRRTGKQ